MKQKLSDRIRPGSEAAPWVCREVKELEADNSRLRAALRPFAQDDLRLRLGGNSPRDGDSAIIFQRNSAILRLRDFDRAKAALKGDEDE